MREYKAEVFRLQKELKDHKEQALTVKGHFADWNRKLQEKLTEFRNEKKAWMAEAAQMRAADKEARVRLFKHDLAPRTSSGYLAGHVCSANQTAGRSQTSGIPTRNEDERVQAQDRPTARL